MQVTLIAAWDDNRLIGNSSGGLPWHVPEDLKLFKSYTVNNIVICGRKTWDLLPFRPLKNRINVVINRSVNIDKSFGHDVVYFRTSLSEAIDFIIKIKDCEIFVIGGAEIYKLSIDSDIIDRMLISHIHGEHSGDIYFPDFDENKWDKKTIKEFETFNLVEFIKH